MRAARGSGPLRWGCASSGPGPGGWGCGARRGALARRAAPLPERLRPRSRPQPESRAARALRARGAWLLRRSRAPGEPPARARGRVARGTRGARRGREPRRSPASPFAVRRGRRFLLPQPRAGLRRRRRDRNGLQESPCSGPGKRAPEHRRLRLAVPGFRGSGRPPARLSFWRLRLGSLPQPRSPEAAGGQSGESEVLRRLPRWGRGALGKERPLPSRPRTGKVLPAAEARCPPAAHSLAQPGEQDGRGGRGRCRGRNEGVVGGAAPPAPRPFKLRPEGAVGEGRREGGSGRWRVR